MRADIELEIPLTSNTRSHRAATWTAVHFFDHAADGRVYFAALISGHWFDQLVRYVPEARPTTAGVELGFRTKQLVTAGGTGVV